MRASPTLSASSSVDELTADFVVGWRTDTTRGAVKIAVIKTGDAVDGPGEGEEIAVYEPEGGGYRLIEVVENPAKYARAARGIAALAEARRLGAGALVASEIGPRGFAVAQGWGLKIYIYQGRVKQALERLAKGV